MSAGSSVCALTIASIAALAAVALSGCESAPDRLNAPPQGQSDRPSWMQADYARMVDTAMLTERSMSAVHFVPGSGELNSIGVRRLNRYATLLKVYGGPLHYDGIEEPEELATARVEQIRSYLVASGVGPDHFSVDVALAGGSNMRAHEASIIREGTIATTKKQDAFSEEMMKVDVMNAPEVMRGK